MTPDFVELHEETHKSKDKQIKNVDLIVAPPIIDSYGHFPLLGLLFLKRRT